MKFAASVIAVLVSGIVLFWAMLVGHSFANRDWLGVVLAGISWFLCMRCLDVLLNFLTKDRRQDVPEK